MRKLFEIIFLMFGFTSASFGAHSAPPCPEILKAAGASPALPKSFSSYCELFSRYQETLNRMRAAGIQEPENLANVKAPRFINRNDWDRAIRDNPNVNAFYVYEPAPQTWESWENAANLAKKYVIGKGGVPQPREITRSHLLLLFRTAMKHQPQFSSWRENTVEIGRAWEKEYALPISQSESIQYLEYPVFKSDGEIDPSRSLVSWSNTPCLEDRSKDFQEAYQKDIGKFSRIEHWPVGSKGSFVDAKGVSRQCGYLLYIGSKDVAAQVDAWLKEINRDLIAWQQKKVAFDPIQLAAKAQRWLVAIHPFSSGNGRISRLVMDEILMGAGLPPPLLREMDDDLGSPAAQWASEIGRGLAQTIQEMEDCLKNPSKRGCNVVKKPDTNSSKAPLKK